MKDLFEFNPVKHVYTLNGKRMYGVTTVLGVINKPALVPWAAKMVTEYIKETCASTEHITDGLTYSVTSIELEEAKSAHSRRASSSATIGTDVHAECEDIIKDAIKHNDGYLSERTTMGLATDPLVQKFVDWAIKENIKFLASEKQLYSKTLWVAGTCDILFEKNGQRYVGDIKTTNGIYDRTPFFQTAAYQMMLEEGGEVPFDGGRCIVRMGKTGDFEVAWSNNPVDAEGFRAALALFKALEIPVTEKQSIIKKAVAKKKHSAVKN